MARQTNKTRHSQDIAPLEWKGYIGFEYDLNKLSSLYRQKRLPQVLLLEGREGMGKSSLSAAIASLIFCKTANACGSCDGCKTVICHDQDELLWMGGEEPLKVAQAEQLQQHLDMLPAGSQWVDETGGSREPLRVAVVTDFERFNIQSMNRLLKVLEEPPQASQLILTSSHPGRLLETIMSRVVRWRVKPPPVEETVCWLKTLEPNVSEERLESILRLNGLAPGKALTEVRLFESEGETLEQDIHQLIFSTRVLDILAAAEDLLRKHRVSAYDLVNRIEVVLNQYYRRKFGLEQFVVGSRIGIDSTIGLNRLLEIREVIKQVRSLTTMGQIPLNTQLIGESIAFADPLTRSEVL